MKFELVVNLAEVGVGGGGVEDLIARTIVCIFHLEQTCAYM